MRETLLDYLVCPDCRGGLDLQAGERDGGDVVTGALACARCRRAWPVRGGVPRFVGDLEPGDARTARNFGESWKIWSDVHDERYLAQLRDWLPALPAEAVRGRTLLDLGCGKGRHLRAMSRLGARAVVGVDLSDAVDVARANTRDLENAHVIQADLRRLPLHEAAFDVVYSIGVLHHTPEPARSFEALARHARPGGVAACWVYGRENNGWIVWLVNPLRLAVTRHLPPLLLRGVAAVLAAVLFAAIHAVYVPAEALGLRLFYRDYLLNLRRLGFRETRHIVYDHLVAPTAHYLRRGDVARWLEETGLVDTSITWVHRNSWSALGRRPGRAAA